jgi:transcriptional regulator with XRE-family HTH domain
MLAARSRAGLTQEAVAAHMGTTKSAVSRLEAAGKHSPSIASLQKYAEAVGCALKIEFVSQSPVRTPKMATSMGKTKKKGADGKKVKPSAKTISKSSRKAFS